MIAAPDHWSRASSKTTFAPFVMQSSAWERIFCGSPCAFTMLDETPAKLEAALLKLLDEIRRDAV